MPISGQLILKKEGYIAYFFSYYVQYIEVMCRVRILFTWNKLYVLHKSLGMIVLQVYMFFGQLDEHDCH
jgi:hypothetical protein